MKKIFISTFILNLCAVGLLFPQIPQWYLDRSVKEYSAGEYWIGVGSAKGNDNTALEQATNNARKDIASQFKVSISSKISTLQTEMRMGGNSSLSQNIENRTESIIEKTELVGAKTVKTEIAKNDNQTYVLVALEKQAFIGFIKNSIDEPTHRIQQTVTSANEMFNAVNISGSILSYLDALNELKNIFPKIVFYNSIASSFYALPSEITPEGIDAKLKTIAGGISMSIVSGNSQEGEIGKNLSLPLIVKVTVKTSTNIEPLKGVTVSFKLGRLSVGKNVSDENGMTQCSFLVQTEGTQGGKGKVTASLELPNVSGEIRTMVQKNTTVSFDFSFAQTSTPCMVSIEGIGSVKAKNNFQKKLIQSLEKNGMSIATDAPILIKAILSATSAGAVEGMGGTMFAQDVALALEVREAASQKILGTVSATSKGIAKKEADAIEKGISSLKIPASELGEALAKTIEQTKHK